MDSTRALFANNAGFACVKLERYDEAVEWYQKTIALDPARAVAYLNLGDALAQLQRISEARKAYEQYLVLAPASKSAAYAHERLDALSGK
jgi:tetratricopeptide (TPR) repeat protein